MTTKYKNKYRIESHRMPNWDYSRNGVYFLTFVTQNRECNLGIIHDGVMELSDFGKIVDAQFHLSFEIRNELFLNEYIIMPNHLHTIVVLDNCATDGSVDTHGRAYLRHPRNPRHPRRKISQLFEISQYANQNQYHRLLRDSNLPLIQKLTIILIYTN